MSHYLLPSTPVYGHVMPMVAVGRGLVRRGHRVSLLTGRKYADAVRAAGCEFLPLPAEIDYDDARLDDWLPGRQGRHGLDAGRFDIVGLFVQPLPVQHRALRAALAARRYDAVVCEAAFLGALPLLDEPPSERLPVVGVSATPLALPSVDAAPFGAGLPPDRSPHGRFRNRVIRAVLEAGPLRPVQQALDAAFDEAGAAPPTGSYFYQGTRFDRTFQLATPGIEYPRRELPAGVRCVGPLRHPVGAARPDWWSDLDDGRPVVHLTQGTMANADLGRLLAPAVRGLADDDVWVVAATGGRPVARLREALGSAPPANLRVAEFLPYADLLPRTSVMVTNGGFGGVQQALAYGVPLVVAGDTEDKPEVAARVAWAGAGLNLRTGHPSPGQIRRAVRRVRSRPRFGRAAARLRDEIRGLGDPVETIADTLEQLTTHRVRDDAAHR